MRTPVSTDKPRENPVPGMYLARCVRLIDLGTHHDEKWGKDKRLVLVGFELTGKLMADGRPFMVSKRYTLSHSEKAALRKDLENWYGKRFDTAQLDKAGGFDLTKILGRPAMVNVTLSDDGKYANIASVNPAPEGMTPSAQVNPSLLFSLDQYDEKTFQSLSAGIQTKVKESQEWGQMFGGASHKPAQAAGAGGETAGSFEDSEIPFITPFGDR